MKIKYSFVLFSFFILTVFNQLYSQTEASYQKRVNEYNSLLAKARSNRVHNIVNAEMLDKMMTMNGNSLFVKFMEQIHHKLKTMH